MCDGQWELDEEREPCNSLMCLVIYTSDTCFIVNLFCTILREPHVIDLMVFF